MAQEIARVGSECYQLAIVNDEFSKETFEEKDHDYDLHVDDISQSSYEDVSEQDEGTEGHEGGGSEQDEYVSEGVGQHEGVQQHAGCNTAYAHAMKLMHVTPTQNSKSHAWT